MDERAPFSLRPTRQLRRRKVVNRVMELLMVTAALLAVAALVLVILAVVSRGYKAISWEFFTQPPATGFFDSGGGIANAIVGTIVIVACATVFALPLGILIAIYTHEFAPARIRRFVSFALDLLNGMPSIVIGIFVYGLIVLAHGQSAVAGGVALAILMLPLVARATQEVLALVPSSLREASFALGVSRWRTVVGVILPLSLGGILTGTTLAIARAAGETAPLLFTCALTTSQVSWDPREALQSIPLTIFQDLEDPDPALHEQAWAAALVLMAFVLIASLAAKALFATSRSRLAP